MNFTVTVLQGIHAERQHVYLKTILFCYLIPLHDKTLEIVSQYEPWRIRFFSSNLLPFYIRNYTRNSSLCFHQNGSVNRQSQISSISFLDSIRYSTQIMLQCDIEIVQRYLLLVYSISLIKTIHLLLYRLKGLTQWGHKINHAK